MSVLRISQKGWVVIPVELRRKYRLGPGSAVAIVDYGGVLAIVPAREDPVQDTAGLLPRNPSLTAALLREQGRERDRGR